MSSLAAQHRLKVWGLAGQQVKVDEGNGALSSGAFDVNRGAKGRKRNAHIGGVRGDTVFRGAQYGVYAIEAADCIATRSRSAFVAASRFVVEVVTTRALHDVAADCRHVSDLARGAEEDRLRKHGEAPANAAVVRHRSILHLGADRDPAVFHVLDADLGKPCDVDQSFRLLDVFSHQIKEVRAAAEKLGVPTC